MNSYLKQYEKKSGKKIENKSVVFLLLLVQLMKLLENVSRETFYIEMQYEEWYNVTRTIGLK